MSMLDRIETEPKPAPRRIMLYGVHGVGKSTWGAATPEPIFIQTEDGLGDIRCTRFPLAASFNDVITAMGDLYTEKHPFKTLVVDSLDWLERLIWAGVCGAKSVKNIEDIGYAKGYVFAMDYWRQFIDGLDALRNDRGMMVVLIAHAAVAKFADPETDSYDRYEPRLHKAASHLIQEWCDEVLFANYKVHTRVVDEGFDKKKAKGIGTGERIMRTTSRPAHVAKSRLGLPDEMPFEWSAFAKFLPNGQQAETPAPPEAKAPTKTKIAK